MPNVIVVGAQWGDEGKGKIIDLLTSEAQHIVRAQGGNNAGHTIMIGQEEYKLHLTPSGILHPHTQCYIGGGTVIDPEVLIKELQGLQGRTIQTQDRLWISPQSHVIFPYHKTLDLLLEKRKGSRSIGTTGKGIGPCYADKANRLGIRVGELIRPELFSKALQSILPLKNEEITKVYGGSPMTFEFIYEAYCRYADYLRPYVDDIGERLFQAMQAKANILFEGAQGTFLDIISGTYPFVTSSNTVAAGICVGAGIGPSHIDHTLGVIKAYTTRVGNGPFPTELSETEIFLDHLQAREFGTTTGRKRRIGWFDAILAKTAVRLNGLSSLAVTKLDILDKLDKINICTGYQLDGKHIDFLPSVAEDIARLKPVYKSFPGWQSSTTDITHYSRLPAQAKNYLKAIEEFCQIPISIISTGPERHRTMILNNPFDSTRASN